MKNRQAENILKWLEEVREEVEDEKLSRKINEIHYSFQLLCEYEDIE